MKASLGLIPATIGAEFLSVIQSCKPLHCDEVRGSTALLLTKKLAFFVCNGEPACVYTAD